MLIAIAALSKIQIWKQKNYGAFRIIF